MTNKASLLAPAFVLTAFFTTAAFAETPPPQLSCLNSATPTHVPGGDWTCPPVSDMPPNFSCPKGHKFLKGFNDTQTAGQPAAQIYWACVKSDGKYPAEIDGPMIVWFEDGKRKAREGVVKNKKVSGKYSLWNESGDLVKSGEYKNGNKTGLWTYRDSAGTTRTETNADRIAAAKQEREAKNIAKSQCDCQVTKSYLEDQLNREKAISERTGVVNLSRRDQLGRALQNVDEYLDSLSGRVPASDTACTGRFTIYLETACLDAFAAWKMKQGY